MHVYIYMCVCIVCVYMQMPKENTKWPVLYLPCSFEAGSFAEPEATLARLAIYQTSGSISTCLPTWAAGTLGQSCECGRLWVWCSEPRLPWLCSKHSYSLNYLPGQGHCCLHLMLDWKKEEHDVIWTSWVKSFIFLFTSVHWPLGKKKKIKEMQENWKKIRKRNGGSWHTRADKRK